ncbi:family 10 glycosylhydrolase [Stygiobacter electus]|uniref:Family 10 glycosylhydrolase n=1 Tax=Stygiobacter electus TaxID=3032292 RepID=A0AAE3TCA2_9BACT|nr:family 10 glycosylhydrolase [Stygiobacter electus]MDF1612208.1 family 10 glycosylhydrolase [Stygiobacter electus]
MKKIFYLILLVIVSTNIFSQTNLPKREFRATWIASVTNIDWPSSRGQSVEDLKKSLTDLLDAIKDANLNAVFFQVRPECDALYKSSIEPWSYWLTGTQGKAPADNFDPLEFAIQEAHKRGIELHAWLNPYRARQASTYTRDANHISNTKPDWIMKFGNLWILNPGKPEVRNYNLQVVMDIVKRYDVDGIHFDDYFYPYPPDNMASNASYNSYDDKDFANDPRGFTSKDDWRRDNVNILMKAISDSVHKIKPHIKFGISPFGIWKNGVPSGITGMDAYNVIYADPIAWLKNGTVDYLIPQLYWKIGGNQDYNKLMPWWADSTAKYGKHFYTGNIYGSFTNAELPNQLKANRNNSKTSGMVLFSAKHIPLNTLKFTDSLKNTYYKYPALVPSMDWKDKINPNAPTNLRWDKLAGVRGDGLIWNEPTSASDGDKAFMYAIYKLNSSSLQQGDLDKSSNLYNIVGTNYASLKSAENISGTLYFTVTSLDRNYNESSNSNVIAVNVAVPQKPLQLLPADNALNQKDTIKFVWENTPHSNSNRLQIATDKDFTNIIFNQSNIVDTFKVITGLKGLTTYYWRITASNLAGESAYSDVRSFTTGFPLPPTLLSPLDKTTNVTLTPTLVWNKSKVAIQYNLKVADGLSIVPSITILDTTLADTFFTFKKKLSENKIYTWSVSAINQYGKSELAEPFKFKTQTQSAIEDNSIPTEFVLYQNYPNPFNPTTTISYQIPKECEVKLSIYDLLGKEVAVIVNEFQKPGIYNIEFRTQNSELSSGVYFYRLQAGSFVSTKKFVIMK